MDKIAVLIPCYNEARTVTNKACLVLLLAVGFTFAEKSESHPPKIRPIKIRQLTALSNEHQLPYFYRFFLTSAPHPGLRW